MVHSALVAAALTATVAAPVHHPTRLEREAHHLRVKVIHLYGKRAPGCDLIAGKCHRYLHPHWTVKHRYVVVLRRMVTSPRAAHLLSPSRPYVAPAFSATPRATGAPLSSIRSCESGSNYSTNTGNGFYGAYQFTKSTWVSVGGSGNPANASPAEQDRRAAMLYAREGASPWPVCGR